MNSEKLAMWKECVMEHIESVSTVLNDKEIIRNMMIEHLSQFFDWDEIEFEQNFSSVTMIWKYQSDPIIRIDKIRDLGMDFIISHKFTHDLGDGVNITVYPFGLPEMES